MGDPLQLQLLVVGEWRRQQLAGAVLRTVLNLDLEPELVVLDEVVGVVGNVVAVVAVVGVVCRPLANWSSNNILLWRQWSWQSG